jgi:hypothetical protein
MAIDVDWARLADLEGRTLKGAVFSLLQDAAQRIQREEPDSPTLLSLVPRLADLIAAKPELHGYREIYSAYARSVGLWNYIDRTHADEQDQLVAEAVTVPDLDGLTLHKEQVAALNILFAGRNLVLSAPTSFGKSLLIDALVASGRYSRIAVVVPTIALLDEIRRRMVRRFGDRFAVVMHHAERTSAQANQVIFLGTQERLLNREDVGELDLVVVDEFYKLDPKRKDERSTALNAAVYQLLRRSKQFLFIGPNIEDVVISSENRWNFEFLRTRFSTVAVDTFDLRGEKDKPGRLAKEVYRDNNWPALVFLSSPDKANKLAEALSTEHGPVGTGAPLARWIVNNYGSNWPISAAVKAGIAVHHGRIPRALASRFVRYFNDRKLPILLCTSTLIEGVNTAAKSVLIYDKAIARENYDFFTFSNIKGRAGRLGQHHVGQVYLFHAPPSQEEIHVQPPLFGDPEEAPDELIVHFVEDDLTSGLDQRIQILSDTLGFTRADLRMFSSVGMENLLALAEAVDAALSRSRALVWRQYPAYDDVKAVCELITSVKRATDFGAYSANQLALYLARLRQSHSMKEFFQWYSGSLEGPSAKYDNIFKFIRACEFNLPEYFHAVEALVVRRGYAADYSLYVAEMGRWFRAEPLKVLEEQGVPVQIAERFLRTGDTVEALSGRLRSAAVAGDDRLSDFEKEWVLDALPR